MTDSDDSDVMDNLQRQTRIEARQFSRLFSTPDGKAVVASLKRTFNWDEAGPMGATSEQPIFFWTGQRSVIKAILDTISLGERLSEKPNQKHDDNE